MKLKPFIDSLLNSAATMLVVVGAGIAFIALFFFVLWYIVMSLDSQFGG